MKILIRAANIAENAFDTRRLPIYNLGAESR